jgi:iron complex transport system substrate-binding protein
VALLCAGAIGTPLGASGYTDATFVDATGRHVTLSAPPRRIVTIFSSNTEIVAALGLSERIVGIDALTRYPPSVLDRPRVGGRLGMSVDAIVAQRPELVLLTPARQALAQLADPLARLGIPVMVLMSRTLAEVLANIRQVASVCGVAEQGAKLAGSLAMRLAKVRARQVRAAAVRAVLITGTTGNGLISIANDRSYTGDALRAAGAAPALTPPSGWTQVSAEAIWRADPDVLLYAGEQAALTALLDRPGWRNLRASREQRCYTVSRAHFLIPGPRTVDGVEQLAAMLAPLGVSVQR